MEAEVTLAGIPDGRGQKALFDLPGEIQEMVDIYRVNEPTADDPPEAVAEKLRRRDEAFRGMTGVTISLIEQKGSVTQPALVTRRLDPLFETPRFEVRLIDRSDAELGRPLFVTADPALRDELRIGDVVVLSRDGSRILDVDNLLCRSGQNAALIGIHPEQVFPYEIELEGDGHIFRRMDAITWDRLEPAPTVGDRVKVMGGVIWGFAPRESASRFKKNPWRDDLDLSDLYGSIPRMTCTLILAKVDKWFNSHRYPRRTGRLGRNEAFLLYGPPGVGKTFTVDVAWSVVHGKYNNGREQVTFLSVEGSAVEGSLVGSGPAALRELRSLAKKAVSEGRLPVTFVNEAAALLRNREVQSQMLDAGSSLQTHEQFLAMLSGPDEIPGILIVDLNTEKMLDEATRQRFTCIAYPHIDPATLVDQMFRGAFEKERDIFQGEWKEFRAALLSALETAVGTVLVGSEQVPVRVANLVSGRLHQKVIQECLSLLDLCIYSSHEQGLEPFFTRITPPLLYHALTQRGWSLFKCWDEAQARERLVPEVVRPEKAKSISKPTANPWHEVEMPADYDCRGIIEDLLGGQVELPLAV